MYIRKDLPSSLPIHFDTDLSKNIEIIDVAELGFEPRISSFKGRRPTTRRLGNTESIFYNKMNYNYSIGCFASA